MDEARRTTSRRMTADEIERICELRLKGHSVRQVAALCGTTTRTVQLHWSRYLESRQRYFAEQTEAERAHLASRLMRLADEAARLAEVAEKDGDRARALGEERQALLAAARLLGVEAPQRVEHSGELTGGFTVLRIVEEVEGDE